MERYFEVYDANNTYLAGITLKENGERVIDKEPGTTDADVWSNKWVDQTHLAIEARESEQPATA